jgi:glycosyltransferase involved in cell wall biosynthesis
MTFRRKVHWLCDSPSPYNAQLFRAIAVEPDVDLLVHYRRPRVSSHPWQSNLTAGYTSRTYDEIFGIDWRLIRIALAPIKNCPSTSFIVSSWNHSTAWLLLGMLALRHRDFTIWTDTPNVARRRMGWLQLARQMFLTWVFKRAHYVMGTGTPALKALEQMKVPRSKLVNFPYWIDIDLYDQNRREGSQPRENLIFLSCGRLANNVKGHDVALQALALANSEGTGTFEYRIAGTGPDAKALRGLADSLGLHDRVKLLGWLDPADLIDEMKGADVLIHPSPVHEPYGVVVIEAMAAGLIVLASDVTCAAIDRVGAANGHIHRAGDFEQLAVQIRKLIRDREVVTRMSAAARKTAEQWPMAKGVTLIKQALLGTLQP